MTVRRVQKTSLRSWLFRWRPGAKAARTHLLPTHSTVPAHSRTQAASLALQPEPYRIFLATTDSDRRAAFRLRFRVFNLEMNEGLESSYRTGEDSDAFDAVCDHLIVQHAASGEVVGTYRMQTGETAIRNLGYYSAREFEFAPYAPLRSQLVELGRACIHPDHRKYEVLMLLWKGIARYAIDRGARYMIGCSSVPTQDVALASAMYEKLKPMLVGEELRTVPQNDFAFSLSGESADVRPPKLLRTYLSVGARICGPPAMDREFQTIDFLTLMDLNSLSPAARSRFLQE